MTKSALKKKYQRCLENMREVTTLSSIAGLLSWDQETMMPPQGTKARAEQASTIAGVLHDKFSDPKVGDMLRELQAKSNKLSPAEKIVVREHLRDYEKSVKLPAELIKELARVASLSQTVWIEARKKSDFKTFAPWLEKIVKLKQRQAKAYGYKKDIYDPLLDDYEPYMTVAELDPIIDELRAGLVRIEKTILSSKKSIDTRFLDRRYPEAAQEVLCREVMKLMGVNGSASRMDRSTHPFCIGISPPNDVRITTRYDEHYMPQALYGVMHESGHALYEQGVDEKKFGTPLAESVSLGVHESQSRFWENIIGRSRPFCTFIFPRFKRHFPQALKSVTADKYFRAVNRVIPSLIRVEADEVTYNLHIVLRYQLEKGMLSGDIKIKDLPGTWNDMMENLIGVRPKNDAEGVLQDTHWASGYFGYFPTYLLGNLYAAQFWYRLSKDVPNVNAKIAKGNLKPILEWLRKKIHCQGRRYKPADLIKRATGKPPQAKYFLSYLEKKLSDVYS
jgi:carboxypeptidase Taq